MKSVLRRLNLRIVLVTSFLVIHEDAKEILFSFFYSDRVDILNPIVLHYHTLLSRNEFQCIKTKTEKQEVV